jgi:hypothetical protein
MLTHHGSSKNLKRRVGIPFGTLASLLKKCWSRAGDVLFWPKMSVDIRELVSSCPICLEFRNSNPKEPLVPRGILDYPWQNIATDLFTLNGQDYKVVVDYFSRYFEFE